MILLRFTRSSSYHQVNKKKVLRSLLTFIIPKSDFTVDLHLKRQYGPSYSALRFSDANLMCHV